MKYQIPAYLKTYSRSVFIYFQVLQPRPLQGLQLLPLPLPLDLRPQDHPVMGMIVAMACIVLLTQTNKVDGDVKELAKPDTMETNANTVKKMLSKSQFY